MMRLRRSATSVPTKRLASCNAARLPRPPYMHTHFRVRPGGLFASCPARHQAASGKSFIVATWGQIVWHDCSSLSAYRRFDRGCIEETILRHLTPSESIATISSVIFTSAKTWAIVFNSASCVSRLTSATASPPGSCDSRGLRHHVRLWRHRRKWSRRTRRRSLRPNSEDRWSAKLLTMLEVRAGIEPTFADLQSL